MPYSFYEAERCICLTLYFSAHFMSGNVVLFFMIFSVDYPKRNIINKDQLGYLMD